MVHLHMTMGISDNEILHRSTYVVSVATLIICELVINWSTVVDTAHGTSIFVALAGYITHSLTVGIII